MNDREIAYNIVLKMIQTSGFPEKEMTKVNASPFVRELVLGTARQLGTLRWIIGKLVEEPPAPSMEALMLTGLYQIFFMRKSEDYAVVNETVNILEGKGASKNQKGFMNGVLRNAVRRRTFIEIDLQKQPIHIKYSHPDILITRWLKAFGERNTINLCTWNNTPSFTIIHPALHKISMEDFKKSLDEVDIKYTEHPTFGDEFLILQRGISVTKLPGFEEGMFSVQDPATVNAVRMLDIHENDVILDACAAPGGKTILIAELLNGTGSVIASDIYEDRLIPLRQNIDRMNLTNVRLAQADAARDNLAQINEGNLFDKILLDVPCSNTGVIRRRPDARWNFTNNKLKKLVNLQGHILKNALTYLKPGGLLVYSTCSIESEENEGHLKRLDGVEIMSTKSTLPFKDKIDGSFTALIKKL
ncbi:MAG: 16S rRNA (cytosine(967)-C(5))-methyltransferase RsmB [Kiritimatiellae bacterium]|jgi:16S rRNA (cytosine967-C5)-methyltransferase|nr:16S rRNA (cytosine(967)-C(5))-methyltransferase RsmB [Kiritimatiellia bacterium]